VSHNKIFHQKYFFSTKRDLRELQGDQIGRFFDIRVKLIRTIVLKIRWGDQTFARFSQNMRSIEQKMGLASFWAIFFEVEEKKSGHPVKQRRRCRSRELKCLENRKTNSTLKTIPRFLRKNLLSPNAFSQNWSSVNFEKSTQIKVWIKKFYIFSLA
jgi:hypothetical protein